MAGGLDLSTGGRGCSAGYCAALLQLLAPPKAAAGKGAGTVRAAVVVAVAKAMEMAMAVVTFALPTVLALAPPLWF